MIGRMIVTLMILATTLLGSDLSGIWTGQQAGRRGEPEDVAFRFKTEGGIVTGKLFGDEFDLPIDEASLTGNQIRFSVTTKNYYSRTPAKFVYSGTINGNEMELIRERMQTDEEKAANRPPAKQTLKLKRL
jgi:hypothetical protein